MTNIIYIGNSHTLYKINAHTYMSKKSFKILCYHASLQSDETRPIYCIDKYCFVGLFVKAVARHHYIKRNYFSSAYAVLLMVSLYVACNLAACKYAESFAQ